MLNENIPIETIDTNRMVGLIVYRHFGDEGIQVVDVLFCACTSRFGLAIDIPEGWWSKKNLYFSRLSSYCNGQEKYQVLCRLSTPFRIIFQVRDRKYPPKPLYFMYRLYFSCLYKNRTKPRNNVVIVISAGRQYTVTRKIRKKSTCTRELEIKIIIFILLSFGLQKL